MKKAVISTGSKQYLVTEGDVIHVELLGETSKTVSFDPLLIVDGEKISVGQPTITNVKISAEIMEADTKAEKVTAVRYKAKKRVHKLHGHRQHQTVLKITKIT